MRAVMVVAVFLVACGRFGFSEPSDGRPVDVGPGTTTFGETPTADVTNVTSDNSISSEGGSTMDNRGASTSLQCENGEKHALLRFDLTAIAPGTSITSALLHLQFGGGANGMVTLRPLLESWTEGTQTNGPGVANNVQRTATENWTTPGAGAPGSAGASIGSFAVASGANTVAIPAATVQGWIDAPATNFGVMIACNGDSSMSSSENATATSRPQLDVTHQ